MTHIYCIILFIFPVFPLSHFLSWVSVFNSLLSFTATPKHGCVFQSPFLFTNSNDTVFHSNVIQYNLLFIKLYMTTSFNIFFGRYFHYLEHINVLTFTGIQIINGIDSGRKQSKPQVQEF